MKRISDEKVYFVSYEVFNGGGIKLTAIFSKRKKAEEAARQYRACGHKVEKTLPHFRVELKKTALAVIDSDIAVKIKYSSKEGTVNSIGVTSR